MQHFRIRSSELDMMKTFDHEIADASLNCHTPMIPPVINKQVTEEGSYGGEARAALVFTIGKSL